MATLWVLAKAAGVTPYRMVCLREAAEPDRLVVEWLVRDVVAVEEDSPFPYPRQ